MSYFERETWLAAAAVMLQHEVFPQAGIEAQQWEQKKYRVACGFPLGYRGRKEGTPTGIILGQAFDPSVSKDGTYEVFVNPLMDNPEMVLATLAHELIHVWAGIGAGHKGEFRRIAIAIGLVGPMTSTEPGTAMKAKLAEIAEILGAYPHAAIDPTLRKKQGTRMLKLECGECHWIARVSGTQGRRITARSCCPVCSATGSLVLED